MFIDDANFQWVPFNKDHYRNQLLQRFTQDKDNLNGRLDRAQIVFNKDKPNPVLAHGEVLPEGIDRVHPQLLDKPLTEPDPYYKTKFTCILLKRSRYKAATSLFRFHSGRALYLFSPFNVIRQACMRITTSSIFSNFILATILTNCIFLAVNESSATAEYVFAAIYGIEFIIKIVAMGGFLDSHTYFRDPWNWLDFIVIVVTLAMFCVPASAGGEESSLTSLRTFRVLRALKSLSIVPGLRTIVQALLACLKPVLEVVFIMIFLILTIGILGMQSYKGILRTRCVSNMAISEAIAFPSANDSTAWDFSVVSNSDRWLKDAEGGDLDDEVAVCRNASYWPGSCPNNYTCLPDVGPNPNFGLTHFDNIQWAFITCFQLVTLDYWENVYNMILRAAGLGHFIYFLFVILLGPFYLLNLLLAVVTLAYSEATSKQKILERERAKFSKKYATQIANCMKVYKPEETTPRIFIFAEKLKKKVKLMREKATCPTGLSFIPDYCQQLAENKIFDHFITLCILFNTIVLALEYEGASQDLVNVLKVLNDIFTFIFLIEIIVKMLGYGPIECLRKPVNMFDFVVVVIGMYDFITAIIQPDKQDSGLTVIRSLRLLRVFRLAQKWETMKRLLAIIFDSVGAVSYLVVVLFVVLFIFAVIGKSLFGKKYKAYYDHQLNITENHNTLAPNTAPRWNFNDFLQSFLLVFRVLCGEWVEPLYDCITITDQHGACVGVMLSVMLLANFLVFNLFVAILLEAFNVDNLRKESEKEKRKKRAKRKLMCVLRAVHAFNLKVRDPKRRTNLAKIRRTIGTTWDYWLTKGGNGQEEHGRDRSQSMAQKSDSKRNNARNSTIVPSDNRYQSDGALDGPKRGIELAKMNGVKDMRSNADSLNGLTLPGNNMPRTISQLEDIAKAGQDIIQRELEYNPVDITSPKSEGRGRKSTVDNLTTARQAHPTESGTSVVSSESIYKSAEALHSDVDVDDLKQKPWTQHRNGLPKNSNNNNNNDQSSSSYKPAEKPENTSCFQRWRRHVTLTCRRIVKAPAFEYTILFMILGSTVALCLDDVNLKHRPQLKTALDILEIIFTVVFTIEMLLKFVAYGLKTYFTNFWCLLDFLIVTTSWAALGIQWYNGANAHNCVPVAAAVVNGTSVVTKCSQATREVHELGALKALRALRAFRPLRAVSRWRGMRVVMDALIFCIPSIGNVILVCLLFWSIFGIAAVNLFGGTFGFCIDGEGEKIMPNLRINWTMQIDGDCLADSDNCYNALGGTTPLIRTNETTELGALCQPDKDNCFNSAGDPVPIQIVTRSICQQTSGYTWTVPHETCDNVLFSFVALFQVATFEGWMEVIAAAQDSNGKYNQPLFNASPVLAYVFFILFIIVGSFFILNLIVGVIIESFQQLSKKANMSAIEAIMTEDQRKFVTAVKALFTAKPKKICPKPDSFMRQKAWELVLHPTFEMGIFVIIMLNMLLLALESYNLDKFWLDIIFYGDVAFTVIFCVEACIKYYALQIYYFIDPFNVFDFLICMVSVIGIILELAERVMVSAGLVRIVRVFRVFRILRAVRAARGIRRLMITLIISLPALGNIGILILVFIIIYAVLGMTFFMNSAKVGALNEVVNFETFPSSAVLLMRLMTGAGWNDVYDSLLEGNMCTTTFSDPGLETKDCGFYAVTTIYFISFLFILFLVIINTYIAVILDNFADLFEQEKLGITNEDLDNFYVTWARYDPDATQFVESIKLPELLDQLPTPLKVAKPNSVKIAALNLPILPGNKVHCLDVLSTLVRIIIGEGVELPDDVVSAAEKSLEKNFPERIGMLPVTSTMEERRKQIAAKAIQRMWKRHQLRRQKADQLAPQSGSQPPLPSSSSRKPQSIPASSNSSGKNKKSDTNNNSENQPNKYDIARAHNII